MNVSQCSVVSAIIVANSKLLLLKRDEKEGIRDPGKWQLPGGGVENEESAEEAIRRELYEEIGIVPNLLRFLISPSPEVDVFYARLSQEEERNIRKGSEGSELRFFSFEQLSNIQLTQKLQGIFNEQKETIKSLIA